MINLKPGISLVINTKNEENNIQECIASVIKIVDEVIVVDMASTDRTVEIAKKLGARTFKIKDYGFVEPARSFAISKARFRWVLVLDADERIGKTLAGEIVHIVRDDQYDVVMIPFKNIIFGKWIRHAHWWPNHIARLFKNGYVLWPKTIHGQPVCKGRILTLFPRESNAILHYNVINISDFVEKTDKYTSYGQELFGKRKFSLEEMLDYYEKEFTYRFFDEKGYLDGLHGFILSKLMEYYRFLEIAKHWEAKGYKNIVDPEKLKTFVNKRLTNLHETSEINRLNREIARLENEQRTFKYLKIYKVWQFYCRLRDKLMK